MRALEAKVSGREPVVVIVGGFWAGFAAREEALAKGLVDGDGDEMLLLPMEKGFAEVDAEEGFAPKRDSPMLDLFCCVEAIVAS